MSNVKITNGDEEQEVTLADIAGIDMATVVENEGGFDSTPKGAYRFKCTDGELTEIEVTNKKTGDKENRAIIRFKFDIVAVHSLVDDDIKAEDWVGKEHQEGIFVNDVAKSVGQAKAIMTNAGFSGTGTLQELMDGFCGTEFDAPIGQRKDKNDPDRVYSNIKIGKITPVAGVGIAAKAAG